MPMVLEAHWYCIQTRNKHEHIAAAKLRELAGVEVFNPQIRSRKATTRGPVWFTDALFPCYLFARFVLAQRVGEVRRAGGVVDVVHFGDRWPTLPDGFVQEIRSQMDGKELLVREAVLQPGDPVRVSGGLMDGAQGVVHGFASGRNRVRVLLDFLGRMTEMELGGEALVLDENLRAWMKSL